MAFDGATGQVAFDEFGDTTTKVLTVYKVDDGKWVADKTGSEFKSAATARRCRVVRGLNT